MKTWLLVYWFVCSGAPDCNTLRVKAIESTQAHCIQVAKTLDANMSWMCVVVDDEIVDFRPQWSDRITEVTSEQTSRH